MNFIPGFIQKSLMTIFLTTCISLWSFSTLAMKELKYDGILRMAEISRLNAFFQKEFGTTESYYEIATIDLNQDGVNEYVAKRKYCNNDDILFCNHIIIGSNRDTLLVLGNIRARNIVISSTKTTHIFDILAFQNKLNDYDFSIYMWSSEEKMYILKEKNEKD